MTVGETPKWVELARPCRKSLDWGKVRVKVMIREGFVGISARRSVLGTMMTDLNVGCKLLGVGENSVRTGGFSRELGSGLFVFVCLAS